MRSGWLAVFLLVACGPAPRATSPIQNVTPTTPAAGADRADAGIPEVNQGAAGDRDGDGVADSADLCPDDPEDVDGYADEDGCPDPDNDSDGVLDANDQCPNEPETMNGRNETDGCPD